MNAQQEKVGLILEALEARELNKIAIVSAKYKLFRREASKIRRDRCKSTESHFENVGKWGVQDQINFERRLQVLDQKVLEKNQKLTELAAELEVQKRATLLAVSRSTAFKRIIKRNKRL